MTTMTYPTRDEILGLEKSYWDALKRKDGKVTSALSGQTSLVTGIKGVMSIAKDQLGSMTEDGNWELNSYDFEDVRVVTPVPDVAIIAYTVRQNVVMDGKPMDMHNADSSIWIRGKDGWECHGHTETPLEGQTH